MNWQQLQKNVGWHMRFVPAACYLDDLGGEITRKVDEEWLVKQVTDQQIALTNADGLPLILAKDHVYKFTSNPQPSSGNHGFLTLNVQVFIGRDGASVTPTPRPGEPVSTAASVSEKRVRIVKAFLATPRDTAAEKAALERAITRVNRNAHRDAFRVELIHWKTNAHPAIGPDAQLVVSRQVGDYDVLIVVFKSVFGTPTPRANSGTEEEYERALLKYLQDTLSVRILVYFADPVLRLHEVDHLALGQIKAFQGRVSRDGVLYRTFEELSEFEHLVEADLTAACREYLEQKQSVLRDVTDATRTASSNAMSSTNLAVLPAASHTIRYPDWLAESRHVQPQGANYFEIDLRQFRRRSLQLSGTFQSDSAYFRFGFKLSSLGQSLFSDGSIQTCDANLVFHIGKNKDHDTLFYTIYRNGRRIGKDHLLLIGLRSAPAFPVGFALSRENVIAFIVDDKIVFQDRLASEARDRLALLTWADEHACNIRFTNITLRICE